MPGRVEGKIALVVGGGQTPGETIGNGRATAVVLAREGAKVVVADRDIERAEERPPSFAARGTRRARWPATLPRNRTSRR